MLKLHLTLPVKHVFTSNGKQVGDKRWVGRERAGEGLPGHWVTSQFWVTPLSRLSHFH